MHFPFSNVTKIVNKELTCQQNFKEQGADGPKWASSVTPVIGGKTGGKPGAPTAIGNGTNADKVDDGVEEARKFIEAFKL
jgi:alanyl-tRNA synthetase